MLRFIHLLICAILAIFAASNLTINSFAKEPVNRKKVLMKSLKDNEAKALKYSKMGQPDLADKYYKKALKDQKQLDFVVSKEKIMSKKLAKLHKKKISERQVASVTKAKKDKKKKKKKKHGRHKRASAY